MIRYLKRLLFAALISSGCFAGTMFWYESGKHSGDGESDKKRIAQLSSVTNEVQRRPLARIIWESVNTGEDLYAGEAIRTSASSEARIMLVNSGALIQLEPNSLVVLQENVDGIALDFLKGNLFVKKSGDGGKTGGKKKLTLKSGSSEIDVSDAQVALSKNQSGDVDLEVFEGSAQLKSGDKEMTLDKEKSGTLTDEGVNVSQDKISLLQPLPGQPVFVNPEKRQPIVFKWEPLPKGYTVYVERGTSRNQLVRSKASSAPGESGQLDVRSTVGKFYWRLVAEPNSENLAPRRSSTIPVDVMAKVPPALLEPTNKKPIVVDSTNNDIKFKWAMRTPVKNLVIEIAEDRQLKKKVKQQSIDPKVSLYTLPISNTGEYFWRLTGYMDNGEPLSSSVQSFQVRVGIDVVPPQLESPMHKQSLSFQQVSEKGLFLTWKPVPGISEYKMIVEKQVKSEIRKLASDKDIRIEKKVSTSPYRLRDLPPGIYTWTMASVGPKGQLSDLAKKHTFKISEMPRIDWVNGFETEEQLYVTSKPKLQASWLPGGTKGIESYRYRMAAEDELIEKKSWNKTSKTGFRKNLESPGIFTVEVEGMNKAGKPIARSVRKTFFVKPKPLLPPPLYAQSVPQKLESNRKGQLSLAWKSVPGAQSYKVVLKSPDGQVVREEVVSGTSARLSKLKPGDYKVSLKSIDPHERESKLGEARPVSVPKYSDIRAPKLKKFKVK